MTARFSLISLVAAIVATPAVSAQDLPIQLHIDHASFAYDETSSLVEMYLAFKATTLPFVAGDGRFFASMPVDLSIHRSSAAVSAGTSAETVWTDSLDLSFEIADTTGFQEGQQFVHPVRAAVPPGEYELQVTIPGDGLGRRELMLRRELIIPDYSDSNLVALSDVTLASELRQAESRDEAFYKNGLVVKPNTSQLYGAGLSRLFFYAEAYNLDRLARSSDKYTLFSYISQANQPRPLEGLQSRSVRELRSPDVLVGSFDLSALPSGSYFLRLALLNAENESIVERSRKFFVYNPHIQQAVPLGLETEFETSQYATMTLEEVEQMTEYISVIMTDSERRQSRSVRDPEERRRNLRMFWQRRDPDSNTAVNEFQERFYQRLRYANDRYTTEFDEGWETDRGRALLKYGSPTAIEPHLFDRGFRPHEIWEYNNIPGEGQAMFVFADRDGYGFFELLHSTVSGERKLPNWQAEIRQSTQ